MAISSFLITYRCFYYSDASQRAPADQLPAKCFVFNKAGPSQRPMEKDYVRYSWIKASDGIA